MPMRCVYGLCKSDTRYPQSLDGGVNFFFLPENLKGQGRNDGCDQAVGDPIHN